MSTTVQNQVVTPTGRNARVGRRFFPELEGMRGLAAVGVLLVHATFTAGITRWSEVPAYQQRGHGFAASLSQQLQFSLPIFFVLSGTLLYRPFALATLVGAQRPAVRPYLWRRALRTLPAYWVMVTVTLVAFNRAALHGIWSVLREYLLLQVYSTDAYNTTNGMQQAWSLCTEILFYLTLPLIAAVLHRLAGPSGTVWTRAGRVLVGLAVVFAVGFVFTGVAHLSFWGPWPIQGEWPLAWCGFLAVGMALATISAAAEVDPDGAPAAYRVLAGHPLMSWAAALLIYLLSCISPIGDPGSANYPAIPESLLEVLFYSCFAFLAVAPLTLARSRLISAVLTNPVVLYLGRISYGIYLWHLAVIVWWNGSLFGAHSLLSLVAADLAGAVVLGSISYYAIERPGMMLRRRLGGAPLAAGSPVLEQRQTAPAASSG